MQVTDDCGPAVVMSSSKTRKAASADNMPEVASVGVCNKRGRA